MQNRIKILFVFLLLFSLFQCAKISAPVGGKRDTTPPVLTKSTPPNFTVNFKGNKIEIEFDEYVQLKNINQKLIVSPPLKNRPTIRTKGKGLVIDLKEDLKDSTTYSFNFGDAIADNNEGNVLNNFQFVFSTGPVLDSLSIHGRVKYAFDLQIPKEAYVLMYDNLSDSAIFKNKPLYVTKINENGIFQLNHLKADTFQLYALEDANGNYKYDFPEQIGFLDHSIQINPEKDAPVRVNDTLVPTDSLRGGYELFIFEEKRHKQYLKNTNRNRKENLLFEFNMPPEEKVEIKFLDDTNLVHPYIEEVHKNKDSLDLWLTDTSLINKDILMVELNYLLSKKEPKEYKKDTVRMRYATPTRGKKKTKNSQSPQQLHLILTLNARNRKPLDLNAPLVVKAPTPIEKTDSSKWQLFSYKDSIETNEGIAWGGKNKRLKNVVLPHKWKPDTKYKIVLYPGAVTDIYGLSNDTTEVAFKTQKEDYYGRIILELNEIKKVLQIQLMDSKEKVIREVEVRQDTTLNFDFLPPQEFLIKSFADENKNGIWDTGDLLRKIQAEKVSYYSEKIKVRSNWDFKKTWSPKF